MENKKVYKIGCKINVEELEKVSKGIVLKGLKVIESSGNRWASRIIEGKDRETMEDLQSIVMLELIENDYIISKECYRKINKYLYNYKVDKIKTVEIVVNDEEEQENGAVEYQSYIEYVRNINDYNGVKNIYNKFSINELKLTEKQKEILNIYSKLGSYGKVADVLGVARSTVQVTIERIRAKAVRMCQNIEY